MLATFLILSFTAATEKQNEAGVPTKPQILWKWGNALELAENQSIAPFDDCFIIPSKSGIFNCFDTSTGKLKWSYSFENENLLVPRKHGNKYILTSDQSIACVGEDGKQIWKTNLPYPRSIDTDENRIFVFHASSSSGNTDTLSCLNKSNGHILWEKQDTQSGLTSINYSNGRLYFSTNWGQSIVCCNANDGKTVWSVPVGYDSILNSGLVVNNKFVVYITKPMEHEVMGGYRFCDYDYNRQAYGTSLICLDIKTGALRWSTNNPGFPMLVRIELTDTDLYVKTNGYTTVFEPTNGKIICDIKHGASQNIKKKELRKFINLIQIN